jgi:GT2 family glycosyltransferase/glycosyltransferase involved in cell wall biosynthesis
VADWEARAAELGQALTIRGHEVETLKTTVADWEARAAELDQAVAIRGHEVETLKTTVADWEARAAELDQALAIRGHEVETLKATVADREVIAAELDQALVIRGQEIETLKAVVADRERRAAGLGQGVAIRDHEIQNLKGGIVALRHALEDRAIHIALSQSAISEIRASTSWRITSPLRLLKTIANGLDGTLGARSALAQRGQYGADNVRPKGGNSRDVLRRVMFVSARAIYRVLPFKDNQTKIRFRYNFLRYFDFLLPSATVGFGTPPTTPIRSGGKLEHFDDLSRAAPSSDPSTYLLSPTEEPLRDDGYSVPRFMYYLWRLRPDLTKAFNLYDRTSRLEYCKWFLLNAPQEYAVPPQIFSDELLIKLAGGKGAAADSAQTILAERMKSGSRPAPGFHATEPDLTQNVRDDGVNLIGYCRGEFGMGEQIRTMARALSAARTPFSMIDYKSVGSHGSGDDSTQHWITNVKEYRTNVFCVNADTLPFSCFSLGRLFFSNSYNIGYWAWELSNCPAEFDLALGMVDEIWAISGFVAESFQARSTVPVICMPNAVSLPILRRQYSKSYFGLPENCFQFMFIFDAASHIDRKNPIAVVRAFRLAFPRGDEKVHLLLKTMNTHSKDPLWNALIAEAEMDPRIAILDKRVGRDEVLGLASVCDAFVSLHRSEGFGFNLAEAMRLCKPVIATNYSGSREFAREGTACVVDYRLVPVPEGSYPFSQQQVWAEPDIEHAAKLMRRLVTDVAYRENIARSGQRFVIDNFNEAAVGARYAARLAELRSSISRVAPGQALQATVAALVASDVEDEIVGFIDHPALDQSKAFPRGTIEIAGWAASKLGIERVQIYCDENLLGTAFYGVLRPDIAIAFPDCKDPGRSGFFWLLDATRLAAGRHVVRVVARSFSGQSKEWTRDFNVDSTTSYQRWLANNTLDQEKTTLVIDSAKRLQTKPVIAILMTCKSIIDRDAISRSLASLADQLYQDFKVIIIAAKAERQRIQSVVDTMGIADRVRLVARDQSHWAQALYHCNSDLVGVMDFGDVLDPRVLLAVAENIARDSSIDFLYADEDRTCDGLRTMPNFKPAFSPIYLDRHNYIGRPWFSRASLIKKVTEKVGPNADLTEHELLKRLGRAARAVCHIPVVLVSRPFDLASSAQVDQQPAVPDARADENLPRVSIVIPTCLHKRDLVTRCFNGLVERTDYPNLEVIIVLNNVADIASAQRFLDKWPFAVRVWDGAFTWSGINNFGARNASGDYLLFLNDDVESMERSWLKHMVRIASMQSVGAVGATLKYENNALQHAGITISNHPGDTHHCGRHLLRFCSGDELHIARIAHHDHECRAVTGACLLTRRDCFDALNGFDETLEVVTNDTDYCLRLNEKGYSTVISAASILIHHEGISRAGIEEADDLKRFWKRWSTRLPADDPFFNPNLDRDKDDWSVDAGAVGSLIGRTQRVAEGAKV